MSRNPVGFLAAAAIAIGVLGPASARAEAPGSPADAAEVAEPPTSPDTTPARTADSGDDAPADAPANATDDAPAPSPAGPPALDLGDVVVGPDLGDDSIFLDPSMLGEVIHVWDEREGKPFDRDTTLRLTGPELARRGVSDLAEALELLPDIYVREAGRGGRQIDIRGARKGSIKVLIDGVAVSDPYYGNLDLSSIPVTDIVQIRVSSSPASPIDGTGGPGGVIEVHTRDAIGEAMVSARVQGSSLPSAQASATGRTMLTDTLAMRASASSTLGARDFTLLMPGGPVDLDEGRRQSAGALRIEYRRGTRRVAADVSMQHQGFVVPPIADEPGDLLVIDGESRGRLGLSVDDHAGAWRLQGHGYYQVLSRLSSYYDDPTLSMPLRREDLDARRTGASLLVNRPFGPKLQLVTAANLDTESADVLEFGGSQLGGRATTASLATGVQYERGIVDVDAAAGIAVPLGLGADPWPEGKLSIAVAPARALTVKLTGGHKGRVPTLRERFRLDVGNTALGPEKVLFAEVAATVSPVRAIEATVASYQRQTNGLIHYDGDQRMLVNTGDLSIRGFDASVVARPAAGLETGASWSFTDTDSAEAGTGSLDFLPSHRAAAWATARHRAGYGTTAKLGYVGEQDDRGTTLPSRTLLDVSAFARLGDLFATVRVDNVAGTDYPLRAGVLGPGRVVWLSLARDWQ